MTNLIIIAVVFAACANKPEAPEKEPSDVDYRKADVRKTILIHRGEVNDCYNKTFENNPKVDGKIVLKFTINSEGQTVNLEPVKQSSSTLDTQFVNCVRQSAALWKFPPPSVGSDVEVTYPFQFKTWTESPNKSEN